MAKIFTSTLTVNPPPPGGNTAGTFKQAKTFTNTWAGSKSKTIIKKGLSLDRLATFLPESRIRNFRWTGRSRWDARLIDIHSTDFAMKFGGGLDVGINKNIAVRAVQFDWNPIFRGDVNLGNGFRGSTGGVLQNNWSLTFGVVIH